MTLPATPSCTIDCGLSIFKLRVKVMSIHNQLTESIQCIWATWRQRSKQSPYLQMKCTKTFTISISLLHGWCHWLCPDLLLCTIGDNNKRRNQGLCYRPYIIHDLVKLKSFNWENPSTRLKTTLLTFFFELFWYLSGSFTLERYLILSTF